MLRDSVTGWSKTKQAKVSTGLVVSSGLSWQMLGIVDLGLAPSGGVFNGVNHRQLHLAVKIQKWIYGSRGTG